MMAMHSTIGDPASSTIHKGRRVWNGSKAMGCSGGFMEGSYLLGNRFISRRGGRPCLWRVGRRTEAHHAIARAASAARKTAYNTLVQHICKMSRGRGLGYLGDGLVLRRIDTVREIAVQKAVQDLHL